MLNVEKIKIILKKIPDSVCLVAVSKTQPAEKIREAYQLGLRNFGENYVQEFLEKKESLNDLDIHWHFIGGLQSNKVKQIVGEVELIQSVDRESLAQEIQKQAQLKNVVQKILLQVNLANEESKGGVLREEIASLVKKILQMPNLKLEGFMIIPPAEGAVSSRKWFCELKKISDELELQFQKKFKILSMGMSDDFVVAIEEGASLVRIGSALFGERK